MQAAGTTASRLARSPAVLVGAAFLLTWPLNSFQAGTGFDSSWHAGLAMVAKQGLDFGGDVVFGYGPLGYLRIQELYYGSTSALAFLHTALLHAALCASLFAVLRRPFSPLVAALGAAVGAIVAQEPAIVIATVWAVDLLRPDGHPATRRVFPAAAGAFAGLEILVKLNTGVAVLAVAAIATAVECRERRAAAAELLGAFVAGFGLLWLASGQGLGDLGPYVRGGYEIVAGYSSALGLDDPGLRNRYLAAPLLVAAVALVAWRATAGTEPVRRAAALLILAVVSFLMFKEGFVRHDAGHDQQFFRTLAGVAFAYVPARVPGRWLVAAGVALLAALVVTQSPSQLPRKLDEPFVRPAAFVSQAWTLVDPDRRERQIERNRARVLAEWEVEPRLLALVRGRTVGVDPYEIDAVWAHRLRWRPARVMQSFSAYTPWLDRRQVEWLAARNAPERILRHQGAVDDRAQQFDPPAAIVEMLCRYRDIASGGPWHVLARVPDRCGRRRALATVVAPPGRSVAVPDGGPGRAVLVELEGVEPRGLERVRALLLRAHERTLVLDGQRFRLVPRTAGDGLLLRVPGRADWSPPLTADLRARRITVVSDGLDASDEITYRFLALPIRT